MKYKYLIIIIVTIILTLILVNNALNVYENSDYTLDEDNPDAGLISSNTINSNNINNMIADNSSDNNKEEVFDQELNTSE